MESPRYPTLADSLSLSLEDPTLTSYSFGQTPQTENGFANYPQPDVYSQSYLSNLPAFNPDDNLFDGLPRSSHDDLNQFFNDASFGGGTPGAGSRLGYPDSGNREPVGGSWLRNVQQSAPDWEATQQHNGLALDTDVGVGNDVKQRETLLRNGQVTPGDSPSSPKSAKGARKTTRKSQATSKLEDTPAAAQPGDEQAPKPKRARKPRKNNKKPPTPEQEAAKRETFLKRNREAAYKCRIKKKNQTESIMERAKQLDTDNAVKGLEVEGLKREIEGLRAMLLPHWRACGDEKIGEYVDGLVREGWGVGKMVMNAFQPRPEWQMEEEPQEEDEANLDEELDLTHPRDEDDGLDPDMAEPPHKRRKSEAVFEMSLGDFEESMADIAADRQRRQSFFSGHLPAEDLLKDALGHAAVGSMSSSGSATPALRKSGMDVLKDEFFVGDTPPPLDLSAPDGQ